MRALTPEEHRLLEQAGLPDTISAGDLEPIEVVVRDLARRGLVTCLDTEGHCYVNLTDLGRLALRVYQAYQGSSS